MTAPLLHVTDLTVRYGANTAVSGLSLQVDSGKLVGLIGPNGAGKTSAIDAITGFVPAVGRVKLGERDVTKLSATRRARLGLGRTWQSLELFDDLSVVENISVSRAPVMRTPWEIKDETRARAAADPLTFLGLNEYRNVLPRELPLGVRKLVGVARALASRASIIAMDEPAAGLDSVESEELGRKLRQLAAEGLGVLLVDHDMNLVLEVCDDLYVIDFGSLISHGHPREVVQDPLVIRAYLGAGTAEPAERERDDSAA